MLLPARNLAVPRCFGSVLDYQPVGQGCFQQPGVFSEASRRMPRFEKNVPKCVQTPSRMGANIRASVPARKGERRGAVCRTVVLQEEGRDGCRTRAEA